MGYFNRDRGVESNFTPEVGQLGRPEKTLPPDVRETSGYLASQFVESVMGTDAAGRLDRSSNSEKQMRRVLTSLETQLIPGRRAISTEYGRAMTSDEMETVGSFMKAFVNAARDRIEKDTHGTSAER